MLLVWFILMVLLYNLGLTGSAAKFFTLVSICVFTFWEIQLIPNQFCWISVVLEMSLATLCMDLMFGKMKITDYVIVSFPNTTFVPITQRWLVSFFWLTALWLILKVCQSHGKGQFAFKLKMHQTKKQVFQRNQPFLEYDRHTVWRCFAGVA